MSDDNEASPQAPDRGRPEPSFVRRAFRLLGPFWTGRGALKVHLLSAALLVLTVFQVGVPIAINLWSASLFDALEQKSMDRFLPVAGALLIILVANMAITRLHLRVKRDLQLSWRRWLTRKLLGNWMSSGHQYQVNYMPGEHDNPDGRIAEDVRITTETALDLAHSLIYCLLLLASFTQILWVLSGTDSIAILGLEFYLPGHLVWVALGYASLGTFVAWLLSRPLVRATRQRQGVEADFRFGLVHARENSEAIALLHGEPDERRHLSDLFRGVEGGWNRQTTALGNYQQFTAAYSTLSAAFPVVVAAPRYIADLITLGVLMQTAQAFQQMTQALSWPIDNLPRFADWRASVERVLALELALEELQAPETTGHRIAVERSERHALSFIDLTVTDPTGGTVIKAFSTEVLPGERMLISGDPGAAMTLFKVVAGLWPWGSGRVELPAHNGIFFMPQRPYLPIGTLRGALLYPAASADCANGRIEAALRRVGLAHLVPRLEATASWEQVLAVGEQQRLGFARLLLHRPGWVFLLQPTDALDARGQEEMMRILIEELPETTVLTVGHSPLLDPYHDRKMVLIRSSGGLVLIRERRLKPRNVPVIPDAREPAIL